MVLYKLYTGGRCMLCQGCNASDVEIVEIVRTKKNMVVQEKRKNAALGRFVQEIR